MIRIHSTPTSGSVNVHITGWSDADDLEARTRLLDAVRSVVEVSTPAQRPTGNAWKPDTFRTVTFTNGGGAYHVTPPHTRALYTGLLSRTNPAVLEHLAKALDAYHRSTTTDDQEASE